LPPADAWKSAYPPGRLEVVEAPGGVKALRFDNTGAGDNDEWPLIGYGDEAALAQPGKTALFEARMRFPDPETADPKKPYRFFIAFSAVDAEGEASEVFLFLGPETFGGSLGEINPGRKLADFFTLRIALDPNAQKASVWLDGKLLGVGGARRAAESGPRLQLGDGASSVGGLAEVSGLRFGY